MITSNANVARRWANGQIARNHNNVFRTDGDSLFSYNTKIGFTTLEGRKVLVEYTAATGHFLSMTTSAKHVSPARRHADEIMHPTVYENLGK